MKEKDILLSKKEFITPMTLHNDDNFLNHLSEEQEQAVKYIDGCSIISAGAGSGKTRVLIYKIAYLISIQVPPSSILALTFTNKAANEMKSRIVELLDNHSIYELWMGTFHSIFLKILRENFEYLNENFKLNRCFSIYDQECKNTVLDPILEKNIEAYKTAKKSKDRKTMQEILFKISDDISRIKNECKTIDECLNDPNFELSHSKIKIKNIYDDYVNKCRISNAMDFDDILLYTYNMLKDNEEISSKYKSQFKYILVDEYQDTNTIQFNIINLIHGKNCKMCVVGDDAQCIYSFRGSKIENIQKYRETYSPLEFKLSINYRSTKTIVEAANKLIQNNEGQSSKILNTNAGKNSLLHENKIKIISSNDDKDEARKVIEKIIELHNENQEINDWESFAILYRTHKQSEAFESQLKNSNIPYKIIGKIKFLEREIIVHIISYLRVIINQNDNIALQKIFNLYFSENSLKIKKLFDEADKNQISYWNVINNIDSIKKKFKNPEKISNFIKFINFLKEKVITEEPLYIIEQIVNYINPILISSNSLFEEEEKKLIVLLKQMTDYLTKKYYNDCCDNKIKKINKEKEEIKENLNIKKRYLYNDDSDSYCNNNFINFKNNENRNNDEESDDDNNNNVINFKNKENIINEEENNNENNESENDLIVKYSLKDFLDDLILLNNTEDLTENIGYPTPINQIKGKSNTVKLMTIHSSKGLEFNSVFIVGVEKGYYPIYHPSVKDKKKHEEEERRMFYVAITRAKQNCFISYALRRLMGTGNVMKREKSQFINELENKCLDFLGDDDDDNLISFNKSSFSQYLHNNFNNKYNNFQYNNSGYNYYKHNNNKKYLNKKRYGNNFGFKFG